MVSSDDCLPSTAGSGRFQVLDCLINRTDMQSATGLVQARVASRVGGYVCFSNVHTVVTARKDTRLREITNDSFLSLPDGRPLSMIARLMGLSDVSRVAGPDFMPYLIQTAKGLRHYFFGSRPDTLDEMIVRLQHRFPHIEIAGSYSPPFRPLSSEENREIISNIHSTSPDVIWIALGAPKQEYWMAEHWRELRPAVLLGVGAAFAFHAGRLPRAPAWMGDLGIEWLHRLCREPRRLWKRYLVTNSLFVLYLLKDP